MIYRVSILVVVLVGIGSALSADESAPTWFRYREDAPGPRLEMAVRRLAQDGGELDLIAVMHIGDRAAYEALGKRCETYEALLYEHAEAPAQPKLPRPSLDDLSGTETKKKPDATERFYDLEDQFKVMDLLKPNHVWADLPREILYRELTARGEYLHEALGDDEFDDFLGQTDATRTWDLLSRPNGQILFKRSLAQFVTRQPHGRVPDHPVLILKRNDQALHVLRQQISAGKKKLGLLYGAGHMPDFWAKLVQRGGWNPISQEWYTLWDLRDPGSTK